MRQSYYDQNGWKETKQSAALEERTTPEPYGAVPPQAAEAKPSQEALPQPGLLPRPAERPRRGVSAPAAVRAPRSATPKGGRGGKRFGLLFALLLILTGTAVILQGGLPQRRSPADVAGEVWKWLDPFYDWGYYQSEKWVDDLSATTVERAPTGDGTVLALAPAGEGELTPQELYAKVAPAVVGIRAYLENGVALGTGVVMSPDGYIITNAHVIAGADRVSVTLSDDSRESAKLVGYDGATDLAVLKIDAKGLPTAEFGDSAALRVGDRAYAIGNPLGEELRGTMTDGIISAIDRTVDMNGQEMTLIQTTAALNSGNSGGALVNAAGQVVGVTNMKMMSEWETIEGLGFAIPTTLTKRVVDQIVEQGFYAGAPLLGVTVVDHFDADGKPAGAWVVSVQRNADAYGKLWAADVIVSANGEAVTCTDDLLRIKNRLSVGDELRLQVRLNVPELPVEEVTVKLMSAAELEGSTESTAERGTP